MHQKASVALVARYSARRRVDTRDTRRDMESWEPWVVLLLEISWGTKSAIIGTEAATVVIQATAVIMASTTVIIRIMGATGAEVAGVVDGGRQVEGAIAILCQVFW